MKCRFCGEELFPNYKGRPNNWKCPGCSRWLIGKEIKEAIPVRESGARVEKNIKKEAKFNMDKRKEAGGGWEETTPIKVNFEKKGQELIGRITSISDTELGVKSYALQGEDNVMYSFLGTSVLDKVLSDELGSLVKIQYLGDDKTSKGFKVKLFKTFVWREEKEAEEVPED